MAHFPSHVRTNILQTHKKQQKVTYNNSYLELKVSGFSKSLILREFAELLSCIKFPSYKA